MAGLTFDTGALIALEQRKQRMRQVFAVAVMDDVRITVPTAVIAEWWRKGSDLARDLLSAVDVEPLDEELARIAGEALAAVPTATTIDAIVMASAARRGDVVYTSDFRDLSALSRHFPRVRLLSV